MTKTTKSNKKKQQDIVPFNQQFRVLVLNLTYVHADSHLVYLYILAWFRFCVSFVKGVQGKQTPKRFWATTRSSSTTTAHSTRPGTSTLSHRPGLFPSWLLQEVSLAFVSEFSKGIYTTNLYKDYYKSDLSLIPCHTSSCTIYKYFWQNTSRLRLPTRRMCKPLYKKGSFRRFWASVWRSFYYSSVFLYTFYIMHYICIIS